MRDIYEVLNQVHSEEEYMKFSEMEAAACIRRVRTKLQDNRKKHVWRTIAAALIGGVVLSGGIAYANSEGMLDKIFHNDRSEKVPEQYVDREYIEEDYANGLKVITNADTKLTFEISKAITTGDMVDVIWTVTYPEYDAETYDVDFRMRGGDLYYGDQRLEQTSSLILGEESDLKENQRMYDSIYLIPDGMELEEGDVLTMKFDGLNGETTHIDKSDPKYADRDAADLEALYSDTVLIEEADWTLEFALQESKFEPGTLDCSNSAKIVEATLSERMLKFTSIGDFSLHEYIKIKMKDGTYIGGFDFEAGGSQDYNQERQEIDFVIEFSMPIDISQVELVVIGNERLPIKE